MDQGTSTLIVLKELAGNPPPQLNAIQQFLAPHLELLTTFWISVWVMTAILLILKFLHEYREHKKREQ